MQELYVEECWLTEKTLTKRKGWRNPAASMGDITDVGLEQARVFLEQNTVPNGFIYLVMADVGMGHAFSSASRHRRPLGLQNGNYDLWVL
ncbi:Uncharacterized protein APZ42_011218 [Daphnia magna]|uniref:Uncharacterized protein n=1 Tax=Daphnia magna TaxID=35525 RepID=A0A0P6CHF4_9CRUS|nr:Uncharacterized protein APZ42_011218 [Daphnia magna]